MSLTVSALLLTAVLMLLVASTLANMHLRLTRLESASIAPRAARVSVTAVPAAYLPSDLRGHPPEDLIFLSPGCAGCDRLVADLGSDRAAFESRRIVAVFDNPVPDSTIEKLDELSIASFRSSELFAALGVRTTPYHIRLDADLNILEGALITDPRRQLSRH